MAVNTHSERRLNALFWQKIPSVLAKVSALWGAVAADGQYLRKFPGIAALLPLIVFVFGVFCGGTHFYVDQPLYMSVIPMVGFFVLISFISGGLGLASILGYAMGYLIFFDHLVIVRDGYEGQMMRDYGTWIYAGIFFNLLIFFFLPTVPIMARAISLKAATQLAGNTRPIWHFCLYTLTKGMMTALLMMVWVQMVTLGAFSYYLWWNRGYGVWDFTQFIQADLWGLHPLIWVALIGVILRMTAEIIIATLPGEAVHVPALPSPFKLYQKIPLSLKSVLAALFMFLVLQAYMADARRLWFNLAAGLILLYLLRDGIEVWMHKWFSMIERVPLAYRLIILFCVMGYCADVLTEYLHHHFFRRTPEPHILALAITLCLPIAFLLISKNEPHRNNPPPNAPFWLKPLMALLRKIKVPQALRKRFIKTAPIILLFAALGFTTSAAAHHCFQGCDSCDYFTRLFNWIAGGTTGILGIFLSLTPQGTMFETVTGMDLGTGRKMSPEERLLNLTPGGKLKKLRKALNLLGLATGLGAGNTTGTEGEESGKGLVITITPNKKADESQNRPKDKGKPDNKTRQSKPKDAPSGTIPIDKAKKKFGLDTEKVHDIKDAVDAGSSDWTGITPNGEVITTDENGNAVNHGHIDLF